MTKPKKAVFRETLKEVAGGAVKVLESNKAWGDIIYVPPEVLGQRGPIKAKAIFDLAGKGYSYRRIAKALKMKHHSNVVFYLDKYYLGFRKKKP